MVEECLLETNLDDVSAEVLGYAAERLLKEGAKDVCFIPVMGKKGRPGFIMRVICGKRDSKRLAAVIMEETGSLGVRESIFRKHVAQREIKEVKTKFGKVRVKVSKTKNMRRVKPEYEDVRSAAIKSKKPFREVYDEIVRNLE